MDLTRAFICVEMPDSVIKEIARIQEVLSGQKFTGKMTELENLHLTLKFLGEIDAEKLEIVRERLRSVEFNKFEARLMYSGTFSVRGAPKIVWVKVGNPGIAELQARVDNALSELFKPEERFMSHVTIARLKYVKDKKGFNEYVKNLGVKEISWEVDSFVLKSSELRPNGPVYRDVERYSSDEARNKS